MHYLSFSLDLLQINELVLSGDAGVALRGCAVSIQSSYCCTDSLCVTYADTSRP